MDIKTVPKPEGNAIVYCEGFFNTTYGKTAHGLVRFTHRYHVLSVVDSRYAGRDASEVLDGKPKNIPVVASIEEGIKAAQAAGTPATHMVIGIAPDGGILSPVSRQHVLTAIRLGLNIDSGLHHYLAEDPEIAGAASQYNVQLRDIRKQPPKEKLHFFSGKIEEVKALKIAILGTDSAVGKRTTAWMLVHGLNDAGYKAEMVGTGQTAWMQGAKYSIILDTTVNDFLAGEIEHAVWSAWNENRPDVIVIEGQGSMMNPAYPGGYEILAAGRPDLIILQHAPARKEYDGFPGYPIHPLARQIQGVEFVSGKPVAAITINHEGLLPGQIPPLCDALRQVTGLPALDPLYSGSGELVNILKPYLDKWTRK
ncbi:MAG: DUF1611 domain-containing protein [Acidobacteria bacterium]|jgi:uncharacterized NAD-dependent epimerase/dehydratase family protein|nr:DUF1611 domain-containing protein [Acidobacteriota bacterium]